MCRLANASWSLDRCFLGSAADGLVVLIIIINKSTRVLLTGFRIYTYKQMIDGLADWAVEGGTMAGGMVAGEGRGSFDKRLMVIF